MTLSLINKGFNYVDYFNSGYALADSLPSLKQTHANSIATTIQYGINPQNDTVYADTIATDTSAAYGATIREAVSDGLSVMVRPLIDFVNPGYLTGTPYHFYEWRSYFNPGPAGSSGANAFFASYDQMILHCAQIGVTNGATSLCIGTELDQLTGPAYKPYWDSLIAALRAQYPTLKLTYAADWNDSISPWAFAGTGLGPGTGNLATQVSFAKELDYFGIDCYAPISDASNPTLAQLIAGWTQRPTDLTSLLVTRGQSLINYFESVAAAVGKPLVFTEIGYENATDAAKAPAGSQTNVVDSDLQAKLYQAFFQSWQQAGDSSLTGVYFWNWDPNAAEVGPGKGVNFSPQALPAQDVVTNFFGSGGGEAPSMTTVQQETLGLYAALYGRAAEFPGYSYWVSFVNQQPDSGGVTLANASVIAVTSHDAQLLGQAFVISQNTFFNATYGSLNDSQFVNALYTNLGGNAGDPSGVQYWATQLQALEAQGQDTQTARSELVGNFVQALIEFDPSANASGLSFKQLQAAQQRQAAIHNKIAVSAAYVAASQQPEGTILDPHAIGDAAYQAAMRAIKNVTSDPATANTVIDHIHQAVAANDLLLI